MSTRLDLSKLSLMDALDLAILIEMEACHRYQMFASQLGSTGGYDAGTFFAKMAENEAKHGQELEARRKELFGGHIKFPRPPLQIFHVLWELSSLITATSSDDLSDI
jgi:rubrerythrin